MLACRVEQSNTHGVKYPSKDESNGVRRELGKPQVLSRINHRPPIPELKQTTNPGAEIKMSG